ncbi:MAG: hypothetical protein AVDCRST_MAG49-176, partial [uncultured Thermomicrobiales bacterium]
GAGNLRRRIEDLQWWRPGGRQQPQHGDPRPRVPGPGRTVGLRQVDRDADGRRPGGDLRRPDHHRRPGRQRPAAEGPRRGDGLPELRALPAHDRARQPRLPAQAAQDPQGRARAAGPQGGPDPRHRAVPRPQAEGPLRRSAAARRPRPGDRPRRRRLPNGRAALQPRRQAPRPDPRRADQAPRAGPDHDHLRHPRPGRGHDDGRPDRGDEPRCPPAARDAAGALRPPGQQVRRRLHRLPVDELPRRQHRGLRRSALRRHPGLQDARARREGPHPGAVPRPDRHPGRPPRAPRRALPAREPHGARRDDPRPGRRDRVARQRDLRLPAERGHGPDLADGPGHQARARPEDRGRRRAAPAPLLRPPDRGGRRL